MAPNLASFFVFRILTAFQGTAFLIIGSAVIGDIYKPVSYNSEQRTLATSMSIVTILVLFLRLGILQFADESRHTHMHVASQNHVEQC